MPTPQFEKAYRRLVAAFLQYHDSSRLVDDVAELARRRFDLESVRSEMAHEREVVMAMRLTTDDQRWLLDIGVEEG